MCEDVGLCTAGTTRVVSSPSPLRVKYFDRELQILSAYGVWIWCVYGPVYCEILLYTEPNSNIILHEDERDGIVYTRSKERKDSIFYERKRMIS